MILAKSGSADVEMSISSFEIPDMGLLPAGPAAEPPAPTPEANSVLDAIGKGKGKGQVDSDQRSRCLGRGHYARDCPTARDSTDQTRCNGCGGKGHMNKDCPTSNPSLKGGGKGWGGDSWGKGRQRQRIWQVREQRRLEQGRQGKRKQRRGQRQGPLQRSVLSRLNVDATHLGE